jgi:hypothetical protein
MQVRQGRVNFTTLSELPEGAPVMTGTFTLHFTLLLYFLILVQPIVLSVQGLGPKYVWISTPLMEHI